MSSKQAAVEEVLFIPLPLPLPARTYSYTPCFGHHLLPWLSLALGKLLVFSILWTFPPPYLVSS